jgi:hypothetical protein
MDKRMQPTACWLVRGMLLAGVVFCQVGWAQAPKQVAPPPADLEPGVNTSATQPSSSDTTPAPTPAPVPPAQTRPKAASAAKSDPGASGAGVPSAGSGAAGKSASGSAAAKVAGATPTAPKSGAPGKAHDSIALDSSQITGNRELPKVLYIVPWKRSDLGDLVGKPVNSLLDEVLAPVDRDVFKRQNRYYDALKPDAAKDAAGTGAAPEKH